MSGHNRGEGDKESALRYDREQEAFAKSGKVEKAARVAEKAFDGPEADALKKAEEEGRSKAKGQIDYGRRKFGGRNLMRA